MHHKHVVDAYRAISCRVNPFLVPVVVDFKVVKGIRPGASTNALQSPRVVDPSMGIGVRLKAARSTEMSLAASKPILPPVSF